MVLAPGALVDDGALDVVLIARHSKAGFLRNLPRVFKGTHIAHPAVSIVRARELHVDADRAFTVYADGDPIGDVPLTIRVVPHAVRVLVPA
jgi:diacylglycerol kinase family enzyme